MVLAASACESARLLLNSKSSRHPQGLANSSGKVGRYLMDTVGFSMSAYVPALSGMPHYNSDGFGGHLYVPWWLWDKTRIWISRAAITSRSAAATACRASARSRASSTARRLRPGDEAGHSRRIRHVVSLSGRGEMIPNEHSFCEIDPEVKDRWGIPVLRFHWAWSDYELNQVRHMQSTFRAILEGWADGQRAAAARPATGRSSGRRASPAARSHAAHAGGGRHDRPSRAAARSFTRSARSAWATIRRRAC